MKNVCLLWCLYIKAVKNNLVRARNVQFVSSWSREKYLDNFNVCVFRFTSIHSACTVILSKLLLNDDSLVSFGTKFLRISCIWTVKKYCTDFNLSEVPGRKKMH